MRVVTIMRTVNAGRAEVFRRVAAGGGGWREGVCVRVVTKMTTVRVGRAEVFRKVAGGRGGESSDNNDNSERR